MNSNNSNHKLDDDWCPRCQIPKGQALYEKHCELKKIENKPWNKLEIDDQEHWCKLAMGKQKPKGKPDVVDDYN